MENGALDGGALPRVWIVEDEPSVADLAAELCAACGADASVFRAPLPYLAALRGDEPPMAIVLDWRLENELSAALFMATRHRLPMVPVIYWTGSTADVLPTMITADGATTVVLKADGSAAFEEALTRAMTPPQQALEVPVA